MGTLTAFDQSSSIQSIKLKDIRKWNLEKPGCLSNKSYFTRSIDDHKLPHFFKHLLELEG